MVTGRKTLLMPWSYCSFAATRQDVRAHVHVGREGTHKLEMQRRNALQHPGARMANTSMYAIFEASPLMSAEHQLTRTDLGNNQAYELTFIHR